MPITVDIADRLYDYTDEEKAAEVVAEFQAETGLDDAAVIALWQEEKNPQRAELDRRIIEAVDSNGSVRRARDNVPAYITLEIG